MGTSKNKPDNRKTLYIEVILPLALPKSFTYSVPYELILDAVMFKRVMVQFGKKKLYSAIIVGLHNDKPKLFETKPILSVIDKSPVINEFQFKLWEWLAAYYMCTLGEVYKAALPSGLKLESETRLFYHPDFTKNIESDTGYEELIFELIKNKKSLEIGEVIKAVPEQKYVLKAINKLVELGAVSINETLKETFRPKFEMEVCLSIKYHLESDLNPLLDTLTKKAPKQFELVIKYLYLSGYLKDKKSFKPIKKKLLLSETDAGPSALETLIKKEVFVQTKKEVSRLDYIGEKTNNLYDLQHLSNAQTDALNQVKKLFTNKEVVLLHGITSSGKTEIYIHLIQQYLAAGKQVLYLLPEIALTTQIITRLTNIFKDKVGVYHSKFSDSERVETYYNVLHSQINTNSYQVILGVRSSLFLPYSNLGLIIIDEEHENTYKQADPAPRYNARDSAIVLASIHGAKVLLGTATPSLESYYNAINGKYGLVNLSERYSNIRLPEIKIVDIAEEKRKKKMLSIFSSVLIDSIKSALDNKEQVILFQNRRGYSPYYECELCGWIPKCFQCDVSLTYHKSHNKMICHYCGYNSKPIISCEACGSSTIKTRGFGTEKIEDEIARLFPSALLSRMDLDSTRSRKSHEKIIGDFEQGKVDILIGTQMISKGLDFDNVSTVGIIDIDNQVNFPDFRAHERCFQLIVQVAGRAGRKNKRGRVIIQTRNPSLKILQLAKEHNYDHAYQNLTEERKQYNYPPYTRLIKILVRNKNAELAEIVADEIAHDLRKIFGARVLGPESPLITRVQNWFIRSILIKMEKEVSLSNSKKTINESIQKVLLKEGNKSADIIIDVDPYV